LFVWICATFFIYNFCDLDAFDSMKNQFFKICKNSKFKKTLVFSVIWTKNALDQNFFWEIRTQHHRKPINEKKICLQTLSRSFKKNLFAPESNSRPWAKKAAYIPLSHADRYDNTFQRDLWVEWDFLKMSSSAPRKRLEANFFFIYRFSVMRSSNF